MQAEGRLRQIIWWSISLLVLALLLAPALHGGFREQPFELALLTVALTLWGTAVYAGVKRGHEPLVQRLFWLQITTAIVLAYGNPAPNDVSWDRAIEVAGMAPLPGLFYCFFHRLMAGCEGGKVTLITRLLWLGGIGSGALLLATESSQPMLNNVAHVLLYAFLLVGFVGGIIDLLRGYVHPHSEHQRRQLQVVLIGASLAVLPLIALYLLPGVLGREPVIPPQLAALSLVFLPISLAYAVLRHHLFDIDAAVDRGLVYAIMTLLLAGCYALFLAAIGLLGFRSSLLGLLPSVAFFAVVAAAFVPLWTWVRAQIDRLIYRDRYDYARTLRELGTKLASIQPLDQVLSIVAQRVAEAMNLTGAAILLRQGDAGFVVRGASGEYANATIGQALVDQALHDDKPSLGRCVRLIAREEVCGLLYLGPKRISGELSAQDVTLVETLATQAAVAVENALLVDRLREKVEELELLRDQLFQVQEEERKRVAQMIHDDILGVQLQMLSRMQGAMATLERESEATRYLRQGLELGEYATYRLREACTELYPAELKHFGLGPALAKLADDLSRTEPFEVTFSCKHFLEGQRPPKEVEDALYGAARQALDNVRRHAEANSVRVELRMEEGHAVLVVRDDGRGFDSLPSPATRLRRGHLGLITVHERIEALDGKFAIQSAPGRGTEFRAEIPVPAPAAFGPQLVVAGISE